MSVFRFRPLCNSCLRASGSRSASTGHAQLERPRAKTNRTLGEQASLQPQNQNILDFTKVQDHLDYVARTRNVVTLVDIDRRRPKKHAKPGTPEYATQYTNLVETLVLSFSAKQLQKFVKLYGLELEAADKKNKYVCAKAIIEEEWKWPSLERIEQERRDWTETSSKDFPLDMRESFLLLGKDGAHLLDLSIQYKVHITFSPSCLKVEGVRGSLQEFSKYIEKFREDITEDEISLPTARPIRPDLVHRISRLTGAFVEDKGNGLVRISYRASEPASFDLAVRLTTRASCEVQDEIGQAVVFAYIPPGVPSSTPVPLSLFPHTYSLYPFAMTRPLPWTLNPGSVFRIRRVGEWLGLSATEDVQKTGGLADGKGHILNLEEQAIDIRKLLRDAFSDGSNNPKTVIASFGHVILVSSPAPKPTINPPLTGSWPLGPIMKFLTDHSVQSLFSVSLPVPLLNSAPKEQRVVHRLVYRVIPSLEDAAQLSRLIPCPKSVLKFEIFLSASGSKGLESAEGSSAPSTIHFTTTQCWVGKETSLDVMLPDRPMDIQFTAVDCASVDAVEWPEELQKYVTDLKSYLQYEDPEAFQPHPPLQLSFRKVEYVLDSSSNVRQNVDLLSRPQKSSPFEAIGESILDLEGNQKSTACKIPCEELTSDAQWKSFLANCDYLSALPSPTQSSLEKPPWIEGVDTS
ncbi:hypothetical protein C8J56DRAFT_919326 [Mycena floridula]|nr:hypothetical protein C8J56DRAFT_919326 [Mycena floridula]